MAATVLLKNGAAVPEGQNVYSYPVLILIWAPEEPDVLPRDIALLCECQRVTKNRRQGFVSALF